MENPKKIFSKLLEACNWDISHNSHVFGLLIPTLMIIHKINTVIEIGIDKGWVSQVVGNTMTLTDCSGTLLSCDNKLECCERARSLTKEMPIKHIVLHKDSKEIEWSRIVSDVGLSVIDGDHNYEHASYDFCSCDPVTKQGGFILAHDYYGDVMQAAVDFLEKSSHKWTQLVLDDDSPVAIFRKGPPKC